MRRRRSRKYLQLFAHAHEKPLHHRGREADNMRTATKSEIALSHYHNLRSSSCFLHLRRRLIAMWKL